jgi:hypothetical protein
MKKTEATWWANRAASRAVADMEGHFTNLEKDILGLDRKISELRSHVDKGFTLHNWMLGTILAFLLAVFFKVFNY